MNITGGGNSHLTIVIVDENLTPTSIIEERLRDAGYNNVTLVHEMNGIALRLRLN